VIAEVGYSDAGDSGALVEAGNKIGVERGVSWPAAFILRQRVRGADLRNCLVPIVTTGDRSLGDFVGFVAGCIYGRPLLGECGLRSRGGLTGRSRLLELVAHLCSPGVGNRHPGACCPPWCASGRAAVRGRCHAGSDRLGRSRRGGSPLPLASDAPHGRLAARFGSVGGDHTKGRIEDRMAL
jgi:hypothetical protein